MTIRDALYFSYAGKKSIDYGIVNVNFSVGFQEEPFGYSRSIIEEKIRGRSKPYFKGIEKQPLTFTVNFAFEDTWDDEKIREIKRWLLEQDYYKPLFFSNDIDEGDVERIYYALVVNDPVLVHNCLKQGYVTLTFRCNDSYAYSPIYLSREYHWDENPVVIEKSDFASGQLNGVILDENNKLILDPTKKRWSDFLSNVKWKDIS